MLRLLLAARRHLLCLRPPPVSQPGCRGGGALRGRAVGGLLFGLELVALARATGAAEPDRLSRNDHDQADRRRAPPGAAAGHARALPRRPIQAPPRSGAIRLDHVESFGTLWR